MNNNYNTHEIWWFKWYAVIANFKSPQSIMALCVTIFSIYQFIWTIVNSAGINGSTQVFIKILLFSIGCTTIAMFLLHSMRWSLLCFAVKKYIKLNMMSEFNQDCILVSCGPGGAFGIGIVSKALQSMNMKVPKSIVVDCEYTTSGEPDVASVFPVLLNLGTKKCIIIHTYLGTGGSLRALRKKLNIFHAPVFCFVMSESLAKRDPAKYCLFVGSRSVLPWPQSERKKE